MIKRNIYKHVINAFESHQIPLIMGLRRIGKTTLLETIKEENQSAQIITFDTFTNLTLADDEFYLMLESYAESVDYLLLDEVQARNSWDKMIKSLYDKYVKTGQTKIAVTGSSSMILLAKELGVNRTKRLIMETWDFNEYTRLLGIDKNLENFENYFGKGGFPQYFKSTKNYEEIIDEILKPIIEDDIPKAYPGTDSNSLIRFIQKLANLTNGEVNESSLSKELAINIKTVKKYIDVLSSARILKVIYKINEDGSFSKKKKYKVYLNPHFYILLHGKSFLEIDSKLKGHIIESYWLHWAKSINGNWKEFYYLKTKDNKEIDFVSLNSDGSFKTLHEFKYRNKIAISDLTLMLSVKATNKVVWSKTTGNIRNIKSISILDIENN